VLTEKGKDWDEKEVEDVRDLTGTHLIQNEKGTEEG